MTVLFGWGPMWNCHSPSPYVVKSMIQLDMLEVDYSMQVADLEEAPYRKAPYIKDDGNLVADSAFIRKYFEEKTGKDLNAGLSSQQRAMAWALERMIEGEISLMMLHERWLKDENFEKGPAQFFMGIPEEVRDEVIESARGPIRQRVDSQGLSRFDEGKRIVLFDDSVRALSDQLSDSEFMFGADPTALDAVVAAFTQACATDYFDTPMREVYAKYPNLKAHADRIDERFFKTEKWETS